MQKFKTLVIKHWIICFLITGILTGLALAKLPNLSNLAIQAALPQSSLTNRANEITSHWNSHLNRATPVTITYSVPT